MPSDTDTSDVKIVHTLNDNIKPNKDLEAPIIYPPYLGRNNLDSFLYVKINNYPNLSIGDNILINLENNIITNYLIDSDNYEKDIIVLIDNNKISSDIFKDNDKIKISYNIENNKFYDDESLSLSSYVDIVNDSKSDLPNCNFIQAYWPKIFDDFIIPRYITSFGIFKRDMKDLPINEAYLVISCSEKNFYYCDMISTLENNIDLIFWIDSMLIYKLAGFEIEASIIVLEKTDSEKILHATPLSKIKVPKIMEIDPGYQAVLSCVNTASCFGSTIFYNFINLNIGGMKELYEGNILELKIDTYSYRIFITNKIKNNFIIPLFRITDEDVVNDIDIEYKVIQNNITLLGNKLNIKRTSY